MTDAEKVWKILDSQWAKGLILDSLVALIEVARNDGHNSGYEEALSVHEVGRRVCPMCREKRSPGDE